jgi:hypothetical protein
VMDRMHALESAVSDALLLLDMMATLRDKGEPCARDLEDAARTHLHNVLEAIKMSPPQHITRCSRAGCVPRRADTLCTRCSI